VTNSKSEYRNTTRISVLLDGLSLDPEKLFGIEYVDDTVTTATTSTTTSTTTNSTTLQNVQSQKILDDGNQINFDENEFNINTSINNIDNNDNKFNYSNNRVSVLLEGLSLDAEKLFGEDSASDMENLLTDVPDDF